MIRISGIYQIQSKIKPERIYIGSSVNIHGRWRDHLCLLKKQSHENSKLQNHYNKYGKGDLIFSVIIGCAKDDLISTEQFYLDSKKHWFNICPKAMSSQGVKRSEEFKKKARMVNLGRRHAQEVRQKESENRKGKNNPFFNKTHSEESNEKRREWNRLHPPTKEAREKQRESLIKYYENKRRLEIISNN